MLLVLHLPWLLLQDLLHAWIAQLAAAEALHAESLALLQPAAGH